jgi:hypothetical protein
VSRVAAGKLDWLVANQPSHCPLRFHRYVVGATGLTHFSLLLTPAATTTGVTGVIRQLVDDLQLPLYNGRLLLLTLATQAGRCVSVCAWEGG